MPFGPDFSFLLGQHAYTAVLAAMHAARGLVTDFDPMTLQGIGYALVSHRRQPSSLTPLDIALSEFRDENHLVFSNEALFIKELANRIGLVGVVRGCGLYQGWHLAKAMLVILDSAFCRPCQHCSKMLVDEPGLQPGDLLILGNILIEGDDTKPPLHGVIAAIEVGLVISDQEVSVRRREVVVVVIPTSAV